MLRIYQDILAFVASLKKIIACIAKHDPDLARQLRRSSSSVALNCSEGMVARGRSRTACYGIALREARESMAALEVAERLGYIAPLEPGLADLTDKIVRTLFRLAHPLNVR